MLTSLASVLLLPRGLLDGPELVSKSIAMDEYRRRKKRECGMKRIETFVILTEQMDKRKCCDNERRKPRISQIQDYDGAPNV